MKQVNTELTFERILKYLICQGVVFEDWMYDKHQGVITYGYDLYTDGDFIHCFFIGFPDGGYKKGTQRIDFGEIFEDSYCFDLTKSVVCEDILAFVREFEYANMWHPRSMKDTNNWSYLYDIDYIFMPNEETDDKSESSDIEEIDPLNYYAELYQRGVLCYDLVDEKEPYDE